MPLQDSDSVQRRWDRLLSASADVEFILEANRMLEDGAAVLLPNPGKVLSLGFGNVQGKLRPPGRRMQIRWVSVGDDAKPPLSVTFNDSEITAADVEMLRRLRTLRNELVHSSGSPAPPPLGVSDRSAISAAGGKLLRVIAARQRRSIARESATGYVREQAIAAYSAGSRWNAVETPSEIVDRNSTNVEQLASLLLREMPPVDMDHLTGVLRKEDYVGDDEAILREYCLTHDPLTILTDQLSAAHLHRIARLYRLDIADQAPKEDVARAILPKLGFTVSAPPKGLHHVETVLKARRSEIAHSRTKEDTVAMSNTITIETERLLHSILSFHASLFFGPEYRMILGERNKLWLSDRLTLGQRIDLLRHLDRRILDSEILRIRLTELFGGRTCLVDDDELERLKSASRVRGTLSHFKDAVDRLPLAEAKNLVRDLVDAALRFAQYARDQRIVPTIISVEYFVEDKYGRKLAHCVTEDGQIERVFTRTDLDPTKHYYMQPLTNPSRIFPILIEYVAAA